MNQRIHGEKREKPEDVVRWLGAVQAQDYMQALWAIGLRSTSATVADVEQAILDGKIVRTWPMRGTLHFVPPEDAKWMLKLSASRMLAKDGRRLKQLGLDEEIMERCKEIFYEALKGNRRLSRQDMMGLLEDAGISTENQRGYHIMWYVSQGGLICLGPMRDKQQTFVLLDEWVPDSKSLSREESLTELASRYFASHGPATVHDLAWWAGLTVTDARAGLEAAKPGLLSETLDGKEYWMTDDSQADLAFDESNVSLLPGFDEYLLGYRDRSAVLAVEHAPRVVPGRNGVFRPIIVVGGLVIGTWKRRLKTNAIDMTLSLFTHTDDSQKRVIEAARSYSEFLGLPLSSTRVEEGTRRQWIPSKSGGAPYASHAPTVNIAGS
ncbi:MAG TPA: winged helix DNA-binding domain-containing protein [Rubrobacter sp.]|nr:winged helix DNA-binding domain-containing protein [Rubrobacter sp.]